MRLRLSVRLWQTALFVTVVLVAIGLLWLMLVPALKASLEQSATEEQMRDASSVAEAAAGAFPITDGSRDVLAADVSRLRDVLGDDVWVFDLAGEEVAGVHPDPVSASLLERARAGGLTGDAPFTDVDIDGHAVASRAVYDAWGRRIGVVVVAEPLTAEHDLLEGARDRLRTTFWVAVLVAGGLGLFFSDFISRRVTMLHRAAHAIAGGDFDQRLPKSLMPDEMRDLADEYNRMAEQLGRAFGALGEREREIAAVVHSMAEGIVALDAEGGVRLVNEAAETVLQMRAEDMLDRPIGESVLDADLLGLATAALDGEAGADTLSLDSRIIRVHATPISDETGVQGTVLLVADVTEQTLAEEAQRRFIATASHEMRTPIAAMKGFLELLRGPARDDEGVREDFMRTMQLEVERLSRLVTELFTLAQIDSGRMHLDMRPCSFAEVVNDVVTLMRPVAEDAGVLLRHELPAGDLCVVADRDRIVQALIALVDNALKYATEAEVVVRARIEGPDLEVEVADSGPGIPEEALPHVFDRFYRVEHTAAHGTGLGLAIVSEIVQSHGGEIRVQSALGIGTVFRFTLPVTAACERRSSQAV